MELPIPLKLAVAAAVAACAAGCYSGDDSEGGRRSTTDTAQRDGSGLRQPANLECEASGLDVFLTWENGDEYDQVHVARDGALIAVLAGFATSLSDTVALAGRHAYSVSGVGTKGAASEPATCEIEAEGSGGVATPVDLVCQASGFDVLLTWQNPEAYVQVHIARNGVLIAVLNGSATSLVDSVSRPGRYAYTVSGVGPAGVASDPAACEVDAIEPEGIVAPANLVCGASGFNVALSWENRAAYEEVRVARDGVRIASLGGSVAAVSDLVSSPGTYVYSVVGMGAGGVASDSVSCEVEAVQPDEIDGPEELVCVVNQLEVFLMWENTGSYAEIRITRDGVLIATLGGSFSSLSDTVRELGSFTYSVTGVGSNGVASEPAACEVQVTELPGIEQVTCAYVMAGDEVRVLWSLPAGVEFDTVRVARNGTTVAELEGGAVGYIDRVPPLGSNRYEVQGILGEHATEVSPCSAFVTPPSSLQQVAGSVDPETGDILLTWQNGAVYNEIVVECGGEEIARLEGRATEYRFQHEGCGIYCFSLYGRRGVRQTETACWQADIGKLVWDGDPTGRVVGYHIYVWPAGEPAPAKDAPSITIPGESSLLLSLLAAEGELPCCRDPESFSISIAAFDGDGNVSELSDPISFKWQVLCTEGVK